MSYCVNCGVELDDSAKKCALCQTPVLNPNKPVLTQSLTPFSKKEHIPKSTKTLFFALLVSMILLIPGIVCFLINILFYPGTFWSFYVCTTLLLLWVIFVFPFFTKKLHPYLMWGFDTVAVLLYVYFFFAMEHDTVNWYIKAALPIIMVNSLLVVIYMLWSRKKKRHWLLKTLHIFSDIGLSSLFIGLILSFALGIPHVDTIGLIIFVCILTLVMFLTYCYLSKSIRKWLSKKFFT